MYTKILDDRLYHQYMLASEKHLQCLISEYIYELIVFNKIKYSFHEPIAVGFGEALPWRFVCASSELIEKQYKKERFDFSDYKSVLQPYFLLVESQ